MPNTGLRDLKSNKDYIVNRINFPPNHVAPTIKSVVYKKFAPWPFVNSGEFVKNENNQKAMLGLSNQISLIWEDMLHKVEVLNLYRIACIEHRKMAASDKIPENYKQINKNNILEIEKALLDNGFTKKELQRAISDVKFEKAYLSGYTEKISKEITEFSQKYNLPLNKNRLPENLVESMMYHTGADKKGLVRKVEELDTLTDNKKLDKLDFSGDEHPYFKVNNDPVYEKVEKKYDGDHYKFFVLKDGKFVDRPAPSNFFSKIAFYFRKWIWDVDDKDREEKDIKDTLEMEQEEIKKVPEDVDKQLIADLTPLGDAKEMTATEEQIAPENDLQTEIVTEQEKDNERAKFNADLKQSLSKTDVNEKVNGEKISEPIVGEKNKDNERVVEG